MKIKETNVKTDMSYANDSQAKNVVMPDVSKKSR